MKVTVDKALIEQAIEALDEFHTDGYRRESCYEIMKALRAALAEPVVEPTCKQPLQVHKQTGWVAHKNQYAVPVLFNPYTGEPRDVRDVQSDPQGVLIVPPGKVDMIAASPPPPAEPARTSQDVCTVPLLSDEEIHGIYDEVARSEPYSGAVTRRNVARAIEQLVRRKAGL